MRIAAPIAAPKKIALQYGGLTTSATATPSIVSQIAGLQSRQSPVTSGIYRPWRTLSVSSLRAARVRLPTVSV